MNMRLVAVGKSSHARHDTEHVVVGGIDADLGAVRGANSVVGEREDERRIVDAGEVAGAAGLVVLRLEGEGVDVDADGGDVGVVLVRLDQVEVASLALREPVVTVELDLGSHDRVLAGETLNTGDGVAGLEDSPVPPVGVVEGLLTLPGANDGVVAADEGIALDNPHELLARVVEVEADLVGRGGDWLTARELELLDQVLVGDLGEAATLIRVEVDVVDVEGGADEAAGGDAVTDQVTRWGREVPAEVLDVVELEVDLDLVVLEGDERESKTRVAVEPELEGDVESVLRGALEHLRWGVGLALGAIVIAVLTTLGEEVHELGHVANHVGVASLLARLLGELIPDLEPVTVVLVDLLSADLELDVVDQVVTNPVEPAELGTRAVRGGERDRGESGLEVDAVDQVAVAADRACDLLAEVGRAVEGLLNRLHGEVCVATVDHLEEGDLRVASKIDILRAISYELH